MKLRQTLGNESVRDVIEAATERAAACPDETVRDPWPNDRSRRLVLEPKQRKFRVAVVVTHTIEIDVKAPHNRAAAHAAVDKMRTAEIRIDGVQQEISGAEIVTTKAVEID